MRVLIVDDSAFMRRALRRMLSSDPAVEVVGTARNGREGVELAEKLSPDAITMDVEMPEMDGLTALRRIMRDCPTNVLMVSSLTTEGSRAAMTALRYGAADVIAKECSQVTLNVEGMREDLLGRLKAIGRRGAALRRRAVASRPAGRAPSLPVIRGSDVSLVCIGSSTGGPPVVERLVSALSPGFPLPVVIAQHMPEMFTRSMAERLAELGRAPVVHVEDGQRLESGTVHICPGGQNTHVVGGRGGATLRVNREPAGTIYFPSVDALFSSACRSFHKRVLGVVLTGMGDDGKLGARELHSAGATVVAQDEESCVVYGMPKAVTQDGLVAASLPPELIARLLAGLSLGGARLAG